MTPQRKRLVRFFVHYFCFFLPKGLKNVKILRGISNLKKIFNEHKPENAATFLQNAATFLQNAATFLQNAATFLQNAATFLQNAATFLQNAATFLQNAATFLQNAATNSPSQSPNGATLVNDGLPPIANKHRPVGAFVLRGPLEKTKGLSEQIGKPFASQLTLTVNYLY